MSDLLDVYMNENFRSAEGRRGVENLAKLCRALGYEDFNSYGQMQGGACWGDIFTFLEDNSGAIEAITDWLQRGTTPEWDEKLKEHLTQNNAKWWIVSAENFIQEGGIQGAGFESKEEAEDALKAGPFEVDDKVAFGLNNMHELIPCEPNEKE